MLYLGIDQHARQITISLRDDHGDVLQARQVSTQPEKIQTFFAKLTRDCVQRGESFIAVLLRRGSFAIESDNQTEGCCHSQLVRSRLPNHRTAHSTRSPTWNAGVWYSPSSSMRSTVIHSLRAFAPR